MWSINIFSLLTVFSLVSVELSIASPSQHVETSLLNFMIESRALTQENPTRSMDCFGSFVPILNKLTEEYEKEYAACVENASKQRTLIDQSTVPQRKKLESFATNACNAVRACSENEGTQSYFECFIKLGTENTKTMYTISTNASEILAGVQEKYRLVINTQFQCTNVSERAYVENTASTFEELHNCLLGDAQKTTKATEGPATSTTAKPDLKPKEPEPQPEEPETKPEKPETQPEEPETQPEKPETQPEEPETQPEEPETQPENPEPQPEEPETQPEEPETQPEEPETQPENPEPQPEESETQPEEPETQPENQEPQPEEPETQPEKPETQPEEPETQPEKPEPQPEKPQTNEDDSSEATKESEDNSSENGSENRPIEPRILTEEDFFNSMFKKY